MKKVVVGFVLMSLLSFGDLTFSAEQKLPASEIEALRAVASKLKIPSSVWDFSLNPCSREKGWGNAPPSVYTRTITVVSELTCDDCDNDTNVCHVVGVLLKSMNLTGVLPGEFANLTHLRILDLTRNVITGSIPAAWGSLPLVNLTLLGNRISGVIPDEIGNISTLIYLGLEANLLEGPIRSSFGRLTNLSRLLLSSNNLTGEIPDTLGNLRRLTDFRIDGTGISGKLPSSIGNWIDLKRLDLQGTSLEGPFPPTFADLKELVELRVSDFKGDGTFPPISKMDLQRLVLRNCSISGPIPDFVGNMSNLRLIDLSFNNFSGEIPRIFWRLISQQLDYMLLSNNMLNGTIPDWMFGNKWIDLSYNYFKGPDKGTCQENNVNLVSSLSYSKNNQTTWCLRKNLPCPKKATNYQLFINCGGEHMTVNGNTYKQDTHDFGQSTFFVSDIQNPIWAYSSTGDFVGNPNAKSIVGNASVLNITDTRLYTKARTAASSLKYYGLCLHRGSYNVKLHFAEIRLTDDKTFSSVGRRIFDVFIQDQNVLEDFNIAEAANGTGKEVVKSFNVSVDSTLEIHFRWSGKGTNSVPDRGVYGPLISAISVEPNFPIPGKDIPVPAMVAIISSAFLIILLAILVCWKVFRKNGQKYKELEYLRMQGAYFTLSQIKVATKNFDPTNKIGEGGFGPVYKGVLLDGRAVAVKQLSPNSNQGNREFMNEIGTISALQHPNLVNLFGCCVEGNQLLLIYEYMENNSLASALFGHEEKRLNLQWQTRRKICLDIARGLAYLHEESRLKIVHRDIKPTNVLLDKDLNAKISDFGLARLDDDNGRSHISTKLCGTVGYVAPEYATSGYLTEKADVYSYGIVILEIVSGKRNTDCVSENFINLLDLAYTLREQGRLLELIDPRMGTDYSEIETEQMLNLAILCTNTSPHLRPTMTSVVRMIEGGGPVLVERLDRIASDRISFKSDLRTSLMLPNIPFNGPWTGSSSAVGSVEDDDDMHPRTY